MGQPRIEFRDVRDLERAIQRHLAAFPQDIDLVVGVPRSGLLAANLFALHRHLPLTDVEGLLEGRVMKAGKRIGEQRGQLIDDARRILVLDDSIFSGQALERTRRALDSAPFADKVLYGAVFSIPGSVGLVDHVCEVVPPPRIFSWNLMTHTIIEDACVDIDGVLCADPTPEENDDGERYLAFLADAKPLRRPSRPIGTLVTSRLERYRPETEAWLARHGIEYGALRMLDLPDAETRRRLNNHAAFKASVFRETGAPLFIESSRRQAREIAARTGKPVICTDTSTFHHHRTVVERTRKRLGPIRRRVERTLRRR